MIFGMINDGTAARAPSGVSVGATRRIRAPGTSATSPPRQAFSTSSRRLRSWRRTRPGTA